MSGKRDRATARGTNSAKKANSSAPVISNYSNDAGRGSGTFVEDAGLTWRRALLGGVAAGAMWTVSPKGAMASGMCGLSGGAYTYDAATQTLTCTHDQSKGVSPSVFGAGTVPVPPNLVIKDLTQDIMPSMGVAGIFFHPTNGAAANLDSALGSFKIVTTNANGIDVYSNAGITIVHTGDISTSGNGANGIYANSRPARLPPAINPKALPPPQGILINSTAKITTTGNSASAIKAYARDGDVKITSTGDLSTKGDGADAISANNRYGNVTVTSTGNISTGANSSGIATGGGKRGVNGDIAITSTGDIKLSGGDDTHGYGQAGIFADGQGAITITSTGDISTTGTGRGGIVAYNTGYFRGCGSGADFSPNACGVPPSAPALVVTSKGNITTTGNYARGIAANNNYGDTTVTSTGNVSVGAFTQGIAAGSGRGNVTVTSTGDIKGGKESSGIIAGAYSFRGKIGFATGDINVKSIGNITLDESGASPVNNPGANRGISGAGILAFGSGNVTVSSTGDISTTGERRDGILASSSPYPYGFINGGLIAPITKSTVVVTSKGNITVTGTHSDGIAAANANGNVVVTTTGNIAVADFGAGIRASAQAGATTVTSKGNITGGSGSSGIVASTNDHNNKGAGGSDTVTSTGDITLIGDNDKPKGRQAGILATGLANITVDSTGNISTTGDNRSGIVASVTPPLNLNECGFDCFPAPVTPAVPANVAVTSKGNITTAGANAFDIDASSVGDGSVKVASTGDLKTSGANANAIKARTEKGALSVTTAGSVSTTGENADGISAQSGDGSVTVASTAAIKTIGKTSDAIDAMSNTGKVSVTSSGAVSASGVDASGIKVTGKSDLSVSFDGGSVAGGTGKGASIDFSGGMANTLTNKGTINGGGSELAVRGTTGHETIENFGTITGNIDLGAAAPAPSAARLAKAAGGTDAFNNNEGGTFNSGASVNLGSGNTLTNDGTVNVGSSSAKATTSLLGRFVQGVRGIFAVDIDHGANTTDKLVVSETATLSGKVLPLLTNIDFNELTRTFKILSANGGTTVSGLSVSDTTTLDYTLLYPNSHDVVLSLAVNFNVAGLTPNQSAVASYFNSGLNGGVSAEMKQVYQILAGAPDAATLGKYLDQLFTSAGGNSVGGAIQAGQSLAFALRSCPVADGSYSQLRETSCLWAKPVYRRFEQDKTADTARITDDTSGISGGFQTAVAENIWGGVGFSVEESNTHIDGISRLDGSWWQIGGALKYVSGPFKLSGSLGGGEAELDSTRSLSLPDISAIATGGHNLDFGTGLVRFSYSMGEDGLYATPMFDIAADYLRIGGYTESGAGALDLVVAGTDKWIVSATPAIEFGANIKTQGLSFRPYLKVGVTFLSDDTIETTAYLSGRGPGSQFTVASHFDDVYADITAGVQLFSLQGVNLRFNYDGKFGETSRQHGIDAKVSVDY